MPGQHALGRSSSLRNAVEDVLDSSPVTPEFKNGDNVITNKATALREEPATSGVGIVRQLPLGYHCAVIGDAKVVIGQVWYFLNAQDGRVTC